MHFFFLMLKKMINKKPLILLKFLCAERNFCQNQNFNISVQQQRIVSRFRNSHPYPTDFSVGYLYGIHHPFTSSRPRTS